MLLNSAEEHAWYLNENFIKKTYFAALMNKACLSTAWNSSMQSAAAVPGNLQHY